MFQNLLCETCCKNNAYGNGTFPRKEVKLLFVRHNLQFNCVKIPVFEKYFEIFNSCFLYIQHVVTRNNFTYFRPCKLETWTLLTVKENLYMNLLQTIISSFVNKNCCYIIILFLGYVFASKGFVFPLLQ